MSEPAQSDPSGMPSIVPHLMVEGADRAIAFYQDVFGAELLGRLPTPDGRVLHAALKIGDAQLMICDNFCPSGRHASTNGAGLPAVTVHLNVADADATFAQAVAAGATPIMPVDLMIWGDRYGKFVDVVGQEWSVSTHVENVSREEMGRRASEMFNKVPAMAS